MYYVRTKITIFQEQVTDSIQSQPVVDSQTNQQPKISYKVKLLIQVLEKIMNLFYL